MPARRMRPCPPPSRAAQGQGDVIRSEHRPLIEAFLEDETLLGPTSASHYQLLRIATGRDAADTALLTPLGALLEPPSTQITVTVDPSLPDDDVGQDVALA